jgi:hypothetical protein
MGSTSSGVKNLRFAETQIKGLRSRRIFSQQVPEISRGFVCSGNRQKHRKLCSPSATRSKKPILKEAQTSDGKRISAVT